MFNWLLSNRISFITRLVHQERHHYQKHWRSIHLSFNWTWEWLFFCWICLIDYYWITFHLNKLGDSGTTSLSEALKVNSSLTQLNLRVSLLLSFINWLLFNHIPFEQNWRIRRNIIIRSIESQLVTHWIGHGNEFYFTWLINYYSTTFHL